MKRHPGIDYSYRPSSYWADDSPTQAILKNIKLCRHHAAKRQ